MKVLNIELYNFEELSESAKQNAIENYIKENREFIQDMQNDMFEEDIQYYVDEIEPLFDVKDCVYSLSYCQGDGLSFSFDLDIREYLDKHFEHLKDSQKDVICNNYDFFSTYNTGYYQYSSSSDVEFFRIYTDSYNDYSNVDALFSEIEQHIQDNYLNVCSILENKGYTAIYDWEEDKTFVIEEIKNREELEPIFLKDGTIYNN